MSEGQRIRRPALLCLHCIGNVACYRAGWTQQERKELRIARDFWKRANGNFLDVAVLEWCKLFAEKDGRHHWRRTLPAHFRQHLFAEIGMSSEQFKTALKVVKAYRDQYVAHLDDVTGGVYPDTEYLLRSAACLYRNLVTHAEDEGYLDDAPVSADDFYQARFEDAVAEVTASQ